jgi:geranylgeranyl diphosphate synthase type I
MSLTQFSSLYLPAIEAELKHALGAGPDYLREYYAMMEYHLGWGAEAETPGASGKRLRPLLCLLTCAASQGEWKRALPMGAAIELLHNFSLIHDDIQDNSPLRRGRPTVWQKWGQAQAINAGDAMFTLAHLAPHRLKALGISEKVVLQALEIFSRTCLTLTQGQYLDMSFEKRLTVTVKEYLAMIEGKTAALISASAELGALLAGASQERCTHYQQFGRCLGLAFQIQDDLLGIWGDPAITGKSAASDLEKRKKSLPVVYGLEQSVEFAQAYARPHPPDERLTEMVLTLERLGAHETANQLAHDFTTEAIHHLIEARPHGEAGQALSELTNLLLNRNM